MGQAEGCGGARERLAGTAVYLHVISPTTSPLISVRPDAPDCTASCSVASCTMPDGATAPSLLPTSSASFVGSLSVTVGALNESVACESYPTPSE